MGRVTPVYETIPGWEGDTRGMTDASKLPGGARAYLDRIEELIEAPIHMLSTGPERESNVIFQHPYG
jgi:adenylosuccinate synthase